jgi:hypothetical protein
MVEGAEAADPIGALISSVLEAGKPLESLKPQDLQRD